MTDNVNNEQFFKMWNQYLSAYRFDQLQKWSRSVVWYEEFQYDEYINNFSLIFWYYFSFI